MATIKLNLDLRTKTNGQCPVRLRININHTSTYINTGVKVEPEYFDGNNIRRPISSKASSACVKNERIGFLVRKFDEVIFDLERNETLSLLTLTANDIRAYIIGESAHKPVRKSCAHEREDFMSWFDQYGQSRDSENTRRHYMYVFNLLHKYCHDSGRQTIYFDEIDYSELCKIRNYVLDGREDVTRYKVESYMRAAYIEAQRCHIIGRENDPYNDYKITRPQTNSEEIDVLTVDDLRRLMSINLEPLQGVDTLTRARDILWMSFCLCGANLRDMYNLPRQDGTEVVYVRSKVSKKNLRPMHIFIEPELRSLLAKYAGKESMLRFGEEGGTYYTFQRNLIKRTDRLSLLLGRKVNMEIIRRTWATIATGLGVSDAIIDKCLGHSDSTVLRRFYAKFDWDKAREANRLVMDYVLSGVVPNSVNVPKLFRCA